MSFFGEKITNKKFSVVSQNRGLTPYGKIQFFEFITWTKDLLSKTWSNATLRHFLTKKTNKNVFEKNVFGDIL